MSRLGPDPLGFRQVRPLEVISSPIDPIEYCRERMRRDIGEYFMMAGKLDRETADKLLLKTLAHINRLVEENQE